MEEDKILYKKFLNGDKNSFETLIMKYKKNLIYFISRYIKDIDIAEDIFQELALYVWLNKENYNFKYSFKTYLYMITKSKTLDFIKKKKINISALEEVENISLDIDLLEDIILSNERKLKFKKIISKLKPDYQLVIYLTQIEDLSYKETAEIMSKTEKQIKNMVFNAKKSLKKLLIKERVIEMKNNKFIRLLSWIIIIFIVTSGIVIGAQFIIKKINNAKLNASFSGTIGNVNENKVWVGTFQLAWNEFMNNLGQAIEFENEDSQLAKELNEQSFTKEMLNENSYFIGQGTVSPKLKTELENGIKEKFGDSSDFLNSIDWNTNTDEYLIYAMLKKKFTFEIPFQELKSDTFGTSNEKVKYFGLDATAGSDTFKQVTVLFYNSDTDFAVKIDTVEGEELILYKTNNITNFSDGYDEVSEKSEKFNGRTYMRSGDDILKIPFINVSAIINYDELCNKTINNSNGAYLKYAIQSVEFSLNNFGGNLTSEASLGSCQGIDNAQPRFFNFTDTFVLYLKEKDKDAPYFALLVDNIDVLLKNL